MLILDKQKAVERIVALTADEPAPPHEDQPTTRKAHARTYHRVATYERRTPEPQTADDRRPAERRKRRMRPAPGGALG